MLKAQRGVRLAAAGAMAPSPLLISRRHIRRHHSPDRTFSQQIQDRQNTFQWSRKHVFRPHQHFSYDPSSWSRTLEEKAKQQQQTLSLVERVRLTAEREAERTANRAAIQQPPSSAPLPPAPAAAPIAEGEEGELPSYFFSLDDAAPAATHGAPSDDVGAPVNAWAEVPLQELVDEVQRLQHLLHRRRFAGNASLARRRHQAAEFRTVVGHLYDRLSGAALGTSVTVDACAFGWFTLLHHIEPLAEVLAARMDDVVDGAAASQAAVHAIFTALHAGLLLPMETGGAVHAAAAAGALSLEALIEVLSVTASPFVRNCSDAFEMHTLSSVAMVEYVAWVAAAAQERAREEAGDGADSGTALREWVDPVHLQAWAVATRHLHRRGADQEEESVTSVTAAAASLAPTLVLHVAHAALYMLRTLENVTGTTLRGRVRESLQRTVMERGEGANEGSGEDQRMSAPKAVVLDVTAAPRGVQPAPTACYDVSGVLSAATAVLLLTAEMDSATAAATVEEQRVLRLVTRCLQMAAHSPNYDVEGAVVVPWASALLQTGVLLSAPAASRARGGRPAQEGTEDGVRLSLRLLLLLSRLSFTDLADRTPLGRLVLLMTQWPAPEGCTAAERAEWRRLRGVVVRQALERLTCEDLTAAAADVEGAPSWVEAFALGEYDGLVPPHLWRAACEALLPARVATTTTSACTPAAAEALLLLCARFLAREDAGRSTGAVNLHSLYTAELVARGVAVARGEPKLAESLLQTADEWEAVAEGLPESLQGLLAAMQAVVRRERAQTKVMSF